MPNRIIKESICTNEQIDALTPFEETFFYRLIVNADDYGRMDGRVAVLRSRLYPLKTIRDDQIEKALHSLATVELVHRYNVHGKPFVSLSGWERNQSIRAKKSKFPAPEEADECSHSQSSEINCMQMNADVPVIQSESESNPNPNARENARTTRFTPPTFAELDEFVRENGLKLDVARFMDYYTANGWKVGRNAMKDWRATARNWARQTSGTSSKPVAQQNPALNYQQRKETNYGSTVIDLLNEYGKE